MWGGCCLFACLGFCLFFVLGFFNVSKTRLGQSSLHWPVHAKKEKMLLVEGLKLDVINLPLLKRQIPKPWFVSIC